MNVVARLARLARQWIKKTRNELFERQVLGVYWCMYQGHPTVHFGEYLFGRPNIA